MVKYKWLYFSHHLKPNGGEFKLVLLVIVAAIALCILGDDDREWSQAQQQICLKYRHIY